MMFHEQYQEYCRLNHNIYTGKDRDKQLYLDSFQEFVQIELLEILIMTGEIPDMEEISNMSDLAVFDEYRGIIGKEPVDISHQVGRIIEKQNHIQKSRDPVARVINYVQDVRTDLRRFGRAHFL